MISVYLNGRLGNNLFQYAFCRISAIKQSCNFYIPSTIDESSKFYKHCSNQFGIYLELPCDTNPHYWTADKLFNVDFGYNDQNLKKIEKEEIPSVVTDNTFLIGFYQSESYLIEYRDIILNEWFKFNESIKKVADPILKKYDLNNHCFIHFRGTDYKTIPQYFLPHEYYLNAIEYLKNINSDLTFTIITDDVEESTKYFSDYEILNNETEIDFYLLSESKYKVIPNSSFSWWASWLSKNSIVTVAPNNWFNYNSKNNVFSPSGIKSKFFTYI